MKISITQNDSKKYFIWAILFWIVIWHIASVLVNEEMLLASPISTLTRLIELIKEVCYWRSLLNSFIKISGGFLLALMFSSLISFISHKSKVFSILLEPIVVIAHTVPVVSFIILLLIWLSSQYLSLFISFLMVFPIIYKNLCSGINSISKDMIDLSKVYNISIYNKIRYIYLSHLIPYIEAGCNTSLGLCWKAGIAAELIANPQVSIGENLYNAKIYFNTADLFAWTITIVLISIAFRKFFMCILNNIFIFLLNN